MSTPEQISLCEWQRRGVALFGSNIAEWKFRCPSCGQVQSGNDFKRAGAGVRDIDRRLAFSCIGLTIDPLWPDAEVVGYAELTKGWGCLYAGAGLFRISPLEVTFGINKSTQIPETRPMFGFAEPEKTNENDGHEEAI